MTKFSKVLSIVNMCLVALVFMSAIATGSYIEPYWLLVLFLYQWTDYQCDKMRDEIDG